jgi:glutamate racemase
MIGVFDSGVGGLSVWREIVRELSDVPTLYVADQAHVPYGPRPLEEVRRFAEGITRFLLDQGATVVVLACNTASAAALRHLRAVFPQVALCGDGAGGQAAVQRTRNGRVGVIATPATFQGNSLPHCWSALGGTRASFRRSARGWWRRWRTAHWTRRRRRRCCEPA